MNAKLKTKKGYTLVELVVTIAIMSIVAGMGIGIFSAVLNHYTTAASVARQQEEANLIEEEILNGARVAKEVYFIPSTDTASLSDGLASDAYPRSSLLGTYIANASGSQNIEKFTYEKDASGTAKKTNELLYSGVKQITFKLVLHESASGSDDQGFIYLDYKIEMNDGYVLDGSAILNNVKVTGTTRTKIAVGSTESIEYVLCSDTGNTAIVFGS